MGLSRYAAELLAGGNHEFVPKHVKDFAVRLIRMRGIPRVQFFLDIRPVGVAESFYPCRDERGGLRSLLLGDQLFDGDDIGCAIQKGQSNPWQTAPQPQAGTKRKQAPPQRPP